MEREKSCGAIITRNDNREVLLIHQVQGHWCFPKGHVEQGESEHETAAREILEETGIEAVFEDGFRITTSYSPKPNVIKEVVYFLAHPSGGDEQVQVEEVSEMAWVSFVQAESMITFDNDRNLLHQAMEFIKVHEEDDE